MSMLTVFYYSVHLPDQFDLLYNYAWNEKNVKILGSSRLVSREKEKNAKSVREICQLQYKCSELNPLKFLDLLTYAVMKFT